MSKSDISNALSLVAIVGVFTGVAGVLLGLVYGIVTVAKWAWNG